MIADQLARGAEIMASDPLAFCGLFWPDMRLYDKQREILLSVRDNKQTIAYGANTMGKDRIAAVAALWFFCTRQPAKVITTSSSNHQLKHVLWGEIDSLVRSASRPIDIALDTLQARKPLPGKPGEHQPNTYMIGLVTNEIENFQGHHLDGSALPRVLFLFDEASSCPDQFFEAAESQFHRMLAIGNPLNTRTWFYRARRAGDAPITGWTGMARKIIHIDGNLSPNVVAAKKFYAAGLTGTPPMVIPGILSYEEYLHRLEWPRRMRHVRLDGEFLDDEGERLFSQATIDLAQRVWIAVDAAKKLKRTVTRRGKQVKRPMVNHGPKAMGIDSGEGGDLTVWVVTGKYGVVQIVAKRTPNTAEIRGITIRLMRRHKIDPRFVAFDSGGGGKEHADALRDRGYNGIMDVHFGAAPDSDCKGEYRNMRAQLYGQAAARLVPTSSQARLLATPPDGWHSRWSACGIPPEANLLAEDLLVLPVQRDSEGRLVLPPKDARPHQERHSGVQGPTIRGLLGRSPDHGDAFVLACYAYSRLEAYSAIERVRGSVVH